VRGANGREREREREREGRREKGCVAGDNNVDGAIVLAHNAGFVLQLQAEPCATDAGF